MIKVNIHQAKTHFSKYLAKLKRGEIVVICSRNVPVAELRGIEQPSKHPRPIGLAKNQFEIPESFYESLPDDFLKYFNLEKKS